MKPSPAWLELTCEPEETTFRDEGGRFNYLFAFFVVRRVAGAPLPSALTGRTVPVECTLLYEDGSPVSTSASKPALRLLGNAGTGKIREGPAVCDGTELRGSVRFKILKLSRNHDQKRFRVKISLKGIADAVVRPAVTRATLVLSKRKWFKAEERGPENAARRDVEEGAAREHAHIAREAQSEPARAAPATNIRDLIGLERIEKTYPVHAALLRAGSQHGSPHHDTASVPDSEAAESEVAEVDFDIETEAVAAAAADVDQASFAGLDMDDVEEAQFGDLHADADDEDDEDYDPKGSRRRKRPRRTAALSNSAILPPAKRQARKGQAAAQQGQDQSAVMSQILRQLHTLQREISQYQLAVEELRTDNRALRDQVELLEDRFALLPEQVLYAKRPLPGAQFAAPLVPLQPPQLPRCHSLQVAEDTDDLIDPSVDLTSLFNSSGTAAATTTNSNNNSALLAMKREISLTF